MTSNIFPVNGAGVNGVTAVGDSLVLPALPVIICAWRALRAEELIARDGHECTLRTLDGDTIDVVVAFKGLKSKDGSSPLSHTLRTGFISACALKRKAFEKRIVKGDEIDTDDETYNIRGAHLQKVKGEKIRWVLSLEQSGVDART